MYHIINRVNGNIASYIKDVDPVNEEFIQTVDEEDALV